MNNILLLCDSHHGQYLPSVWTKNTENIWNINQEDWKRVPHLVKVNFISASNQCFPNL